MRVSLFIPCYVDAFYPKVGISVVEVLERLGHTLDYPKSLTCCGQPAFNGGFWPQARAVAEGVLAAYRNAEVVVVASGSCAAMIKTFYPQIFQDTPQYEAALALAEKTWEFSDFLVTKLGVTDGGAKFNGKAFALAICGAKNQAAAGSGGASVSAKLHCAVWSCD